jgi:5-methylcytosine-specific restriction endonuclease McrA
MPATISRTTRIGERDSWICRICLKPVDPELSVYESDRAAVVDHKIPKWAGGSNKDSNLQLAHFECNRLKGKRVIWLDRKAGIAKPVTYVDYLPANPGD